MSEDEVTIVRKARYEISAECGHDPDRVVDYYRSVEEELKRSGEFLFSQPQRDASFTQEDIAIARERLASDQPRHTTEEVL